MTTPGTSRGATAAGCELCGHRIWVADRFCANCGAATATEDLFAIDLRPGEASSSGRGRFSRHRDSLVGLAVLLAVVGLVGLALALGGGESSDEETVSDEATELQDSGSTQESQPAGTPTPAPTPVATPTPAPTPGPTPTRIATRAPVPLTPVSFEEFLAGHDLGDGWMVTINEQSRLVAINLETAETIESEVLVASNVSAVVLKQGVLVDRGSGLPWRFSPWVPSGTNVGTQSLYVGAEDQSTFVVPDRVFVDETVGPVIVRINPADDPAGTAYAVLSGETKPVEISDIRMLILADISTRFRPGAVSTPDRLFLIDDGASTYRWTWDGGWSKVSDGRLDHVLLDTAVVLRCDFPSPCTSVLIDHLGNDIAELPQRRGLSFLGQDRMALGPDHKRLAESYGFSSAPVVVVTELAVGDGETRTTEIDQQGAAWPPRQLQWSPNGSYLLGATDGGAMLFIEVATGAVTRIESSGRAFGDAMPVAFIDEIDR